MSLSHFNNKTKNVKMVDITNKEKNVRIAKAYGEIKIDSSLASLLQKDKKLTQNLWITSKIAAILAVKKTPEVIPLSHQLNITFVDFSFQLNKNKIIINNELKTDYSTGIEIEAIYGITVAAVSIYDMLKSFKKDITIQNIKLINKIGGKK